MPTTTEAKSNLDILQVIVYEAHLTVLILFVHIDAWGEYLRSKQVFSDKSHMEQWLRQFNPSLIHYVR